MKRKKTMMPSKCWILCFVLIGVFLLNEEFLQQGEAQIAFTSNRDGITNVYVMDADGRNVRRLTDFPNGASAPAWSPDGRKIAFTGADHLYVTNADGSAPPRRVAVSVFYPAWSPKGDKIAGTAPHPIRGKGGHWTLVIVDVESGKRGTPALDLLVGTWGSRPSWSPDGQIIAVRGYMLDAENFTILSEPKNFFESFHVWSPDGTQIAFQSDMEELNNSDIYVMNSDGTDIRRLTNHPAWDGTLTWSPDGRQIAFASDRDGNREIYVIDADGGNLRNLTNHPSEDSYPAWFPATAGAVVAPVGKLATSWGALKRNPQ